MQQNFTGTVKNGFNGTWYEKRKNAVAPFVVIIKSWDYNQNFSHVLFNKFSNFYQFSTLQSKVHFSGNIPNNIYNSFYYFSKFSAVFLMISWLRLSRITLVKLIKSSGLDFGKAFDWVKAPGACKPFSGASAPSPRSHWPSASAHLSVP